MGVAYLVYAFVPVGVFPTDTEYGLNAAPRWETCYPTALGLVILVFFLALTAHFLEIRDKKIRNKR